jgi:ferrous iron transport protein B
LRGKTGNYPGVTVARSTGQVVVDGKAVIIEDLPGTYSLSPVSPDEQVVSDLLTGELTGIDRPDAAIIVVDATTIERSLLLVSQALAVGLPTAIVVTMIDELAARGGNLDLLRMQAILGVPVVGIVGTKGIGIEAVRDLLVEPRGWPKPVLPPPRDPAARAAWISSVLESVLHQAPIGHRWTERIDRLLLHPLFGSLVFFAVMLIFFQVIFTVAAPIQDWIGTIFDAIGLWAAENITWAPLAGLISDGLVGGVGTVLQFLPQILLLFLMISFLENVGYMSRAAMVMDRAMGKFGLEGRSFVSLLSSYACAVPGIMSTRTIPSSRDRIATIMVAPLMTCSARLPVYTLLIASFIPNAVIWGPLRLQGLVLFSLYLLGSVSALLIAGILKKTKLRSDSLPFYMEIPPYRIPGWRLVATQCWDSSKYFLRKAGTIILGTSMVLWILLNVPNVTAPPEFNEQQATSYQLQNSVAGTIGRTVEPVFKPLGFNWEINIALIASLSAREVFVSTLGQIESAQSDDETSIGEALVSATNPDGSPVYTPGAVAALLVFFVFALQCMSTIAVMRRETNSRRWPLFAFSYMFALAWVGGFLGNTIVTAWTS